MPSDKLLEILLLVLELRISFFNWIDPDQSASILIILEESFAEFASERLGCPRSDLDHSDAAFVNSWALEISIQIIHLLGGLGLDEAQIISEVYVRSHRFITLFAVGKLYCLAFGIVYIDPNTFVFIYVFHMFLTRFALKIQY